MILGHDKPMSTGVRVRPVRVRPLSAPEAPAVAPGDLLYIQDSDFTGPLLTPVHRKAGDESFREGKNGPELLVHPDFGGGEIWVRTGRVFIPHGEGTEMPVMCSAGTRISSSLFLPGLDGEEAMKRFKKAMRAEFGPGVVEVWNLRSGPVRDLRYDVWEVCTGWVADEQPAGRDRKVPGRVRETERRLLARGVRDGHQHHFSDKAAPGWQIVVEPHQPDLGTPETL